MVHVAFGDVRHQRENAAGFTPYWQLRNGNGKLPEVERDAVNGIAAT